VPCHARLALLLLAASLGLARPAYGKDCDLTWPGLVPLVDLGAGLYLNRFEGGLYPDGFDEPPAGHLAEGLARAHSIEPLDVNGDPSASGKVVLLSIGMSNASQEFCSTLGPEPCDAQSFMGQAAADPDVDGQHLVILNGARGGQVAETWDDPQDNNYDGLKSGVLEAKGLSEAQVQAVWLKNVNANPTVSLEDCGDMPLSTCPADAVQLLSRLGSIVRAIRSRYPNTQLVLLSSRIFGGYSTESLNPEPYAYESGFAVKWLIEAQIAQMTGAEVDPIAGDLHYDDTPWLGWGPYLWANGTNPRSDGLVWPCANFLNDGVHPAASGVRKVGTALLDFFLNSELTKPWFVPEPSGGAIAAAAALFCLRRARGPARDRPRGRRRPRRRARAAPASP
jgi:hypothetical protein